WCIFGCCAQQSKSIIYRAESLVNIFGLKSTQKSGAAAEDLAADYLLGHKLKIVGRNYRCRHGEIDLIAKDGATLVFVEVRLRSPGSFGGAAASITPAKQQKILATARHYLSGKAGLPACRFDVLLLDSLSADKIEWIKNAFGE
ncbi:MAG: YraN family protein, partial [Burkholderiales bacterium]